MKYQKRMEIYAYLPILRSCIKLFLLVCCFTACQQEKTPYPILDDEEKLINVFTDMYLAESAVNKQALAVRDSLKTLFRKDIITIHKLTEEEFDTLFFIVQTDMTIYKDIHKKVVDRLDDMSKEGAEVKDKGGDDLIKKN